MEKILFFDDLNYYNDNTEIIAYLLNFIIVYFYAHNLIYFTYYLYNFIFNNFGIIKKEILNNKILNNKFIIMIFTNIFVKFVRIIFN